MFKYITLMTVFVFSGLNQAHAQLGKAEFHQKVTAALKALNTITVYKQYSDSLNYLVEKVEQKSDWPCPGHFMINPQDYSSIMKAKVDSLPPLAKTIVLACGTGNLEKEKIPADIVTKVEAAQQELEKETNRLAEEFNKIGPL